MLREFYGAILRASVRNSMGSEGNGARDSSPGLPHEAASFLLLGCFDSKIIYY